MKNALERAIDAAGSPDDDLRGIAAVATACGTTKQFIHKMRRIWRETGAPPRAMREHAPAIERACNSVVTVEELCPGVRWERDADGAVMRYSVPVQKVA